MTRQRFMHGTSQCIRWFRSQTDSQEKSELNYQAMAFKNPKHSDWFRAWQIKFYNSKPWRTLRNKVRYHKRMRCDMCGRLIHGKSIVDHIIEIDESNYQDESITLNEDNLQLLCLECHNTKTFQNKINLNLDNRNINLFLILLFLNFSGLPPFWILTALE